MRLHRYTGQEAKDVRRKLGMNQGDFWRLFGVMQSSGSRFESGRDLPESVVILMNIALSGDKTSAAIIEGLRKLRS